MYQTSINFNKTIKKKSRKYFWTGEIVLKTGKIINFDDKHILKDSGYISNSCSGRNRTRFCLRCGDGHYFET